MSSVTLLIGFGIGFVTGSVFCGVLYVVYLVAEKNDPTTHKRGNDE